MDQIFRKIFTEYIRPELVCNPILVTPHEDEYEFAREGPTMSHRER